MIIKQNYWLVNFWFQVKIQQVKFSLPIAKYQKLLNLRVINHYAAVINLYKNWVQCNRLNRYYKSNHFKLSEKCNKNKNVYRSLTLHMKQQRKDFIKTPKNNHK